MKILISTSSFGKADKKPLELCEKYCSVILNPYGRKLTADEFYELTEDVDGVIAGVEDINYSTLSKRKNIKVISRCGVGIDNVDTKACEDFGIQLYNTPNAPVASVAEMAAALILSVMKNIPAMNADMKNGKWNKAAGYMLEKKHIGIIGMGRIGCRVAELLSGFDVSIAYSDIEEKNNQYQYMSKKELLQWADVITIHTSACKDGEYIIGEDELTLMKKNAYLINTARGRFIDEDALIHKLRNHDIGGAALDVFQAEPYSGQLTEFDNVILTPHVSSSAKEGRVKMELEAAQNLLKGLGIQYD